MRLSKERSALVVNESLTLAGIPPDVFDYRLGNRSALEWVIDQYRVKKDRRSGIRSDPNGYSEDERYIVELVGRVVAVSLETVQIVEQLPRLGVESGSCESDCALSPRLRVITLTESTAYVRITARRKYDQT